MQLHITAHDAHVINQQTAKEYPSKITRDKTSEMRNVYTSYVQMVLLLQPHELKVSFATLQRLCR